jgi:hypothetical protein
VDMKSGSTLLENIKSIPGYPDKTGVELKFCRDFIIGLKKDDDLRETELQVITRW